MIIQNRPKNIKIHTDEAILRRLPNNHPMRPKVIHDLAMWKAGLRGEEEVDYYLSFLPEKDFYIFQGIRLKYKDHIFQIDHLLLSPHLILPLEVKNYLGTVTFNPKFSQVTRELNGKEDGFEDPIVQAKRHNYLLINWMKENKLPPIPVDFLVAFGKATTILKNPTHSNEVYNKICLAGNLLFKINGLKSMYPKESLSPKDIKKWCNTLLKNHTPEQPSYSAFNIPHHEFIPGVQCPSCSAFRMERISGNWKCPFCNFTSKDAHIQALIDYFLLISPTITNQQCQNFLHLPNQTIVSKLLAKTPLIPTGFRKDMVYSPRSFLIETFVQNPIAKIERRV